MTTYDEGHGECVGLFSLDSKVVIADVTFSFEFSFELIDESKNQTLVGVKEEGAQCRLLKEFEYLQVYACK